MNNFTSSIYVYTHTFTLNLFVITKFSLRKLESANNTMLQQQHDDDQLRQRHERFRTGYQGSATTKLRRLHGHGIIIIIKRKLVLYL